jgi:hypothetical protein
VRASWTVVRQRLNLTLGPYFSVAFGWAEGKPGVDVLKRSLDSCSKMVFNRRSTHVRAHSARARRADGRVCRRIIPILLVPRLISSACCIGSVTRTPWVGAELILTKVDRFQRQCRGNLRCGMSPAPWLRSSTRCLVPATRVNSDRKIASVRSQSLAKSQLAASCALAEPKA